MRFVMSEIDIRFLDRALHAGQADPELVLQQLTDDRTRRFA